MFGLGPTEIVIILVIALLVFGPSRLPKLGKMVGESVGSLRKMKDATDGIQDSVKKDLEDMVLGPSDKQ